MELERYIKAFIRLGEWMNEFCQVYPQKNPELVSVIRAQHLYNPWLIEEFVLKGLKIWAAKLSKDSIESIPEKYPQINSNRPKRKVAVIPQENVPLAGIHDFISVLLTGNYLYCRNLNHENDLLKMITDKLISIEPDLKDCIHWCVNFPKDIDTYLVSAKPNNDSALKSYFERKHCLIRDKRISIGIIGSDDHMDDYKRLTHDIFLFFGISDHCIRKIFVPQGFSMPSFIDVLEDYSYLYQFNRYANNYDYHKSVFMMEIIPFYDNGFIIVRESPELKVPVGCLYFEYYHSEHELRQYLKTIDTRIQNVVTTMEGFDNSVKPGCSHNYPLWEFADGKDTIQFLLT